MNFFAFMKERHNIYLARQAGNPKPWTSDPILQSYRFCNVYRELDTVTIWIRENIREPYADDPALWFLLAMARRINLPDTLEEIARDKKGAWPVAGKRYAPERLAQILDARTARGDQVYTGAYMITAETGPEHTGKTKSVTTAFSNLGKLWSARKEIEPQLHSTLEGAYNAILGRGFAWGPFMTYEVVTDLRHTRYLRGAPDIMTWANAGPGAMRGLNRLAERPLTTKLDSVQLIEEMRYLLRLSRARWPRKWTMLEMRDIEHSLCEFDKYERVRLGEGRPRSLYNGRE